MTKRRSRPASALRSFVLEALDSRIVLSTAGASAALPGVAAQVSAQAVKAAPTTTTLAVHAGTLGQPLTITATVRSSASAGSPAGTVNIVDRGTVIASLPLSPSTSAGGKFAFSTAAATMGQQPGGPAYYFGKHSLTAEFVPSGAFARSAAIKAFTVTPPSYTPLAGGAKFATITPGSGPAIQAGQTANVLYTGYLATNGKIFDDSSSHGGSPLSFQVGAGQVVPGFDAGTSGMQVGETRVISIPPAQGYGNTASGPIPAHSTLIFVVTLQSIS